MTLTDFPALVDTFNDPDAAAGDDLNTPGVEHDILHAKIHAAVLAIERRLFGAWINVKEYGAVGDGVTDDTAAIVQAMLAAMPGDTLYFPRGSYKSDPIVMAKCLHFEGDGRWSSWLSCRSAGQTLPQLDMSIVIDSGLGVRDNYGPSFRNMGVDCTVAPGATGIKTGGAASGWAVISDFYVQNAAIAIDQQMPNTIINNGVMSDCGKFIKISDSGTEVVLRDLVMQRVSAGTTTRAIEMVSTHGGINGAIFIQNVRVNVNAISGVTLNTGMWIEAPSAASIPVFAEKLIIDNCSGPSLVTIRVGDGSYTNCWFNSARGTGNGAVSITGGVVIKFANSTLFGGFGSACSYDFIGGQTAQFSSIGNMLWTGNPMYRFPSLAADMPVAMVVRDVLAGPDAIVCNEGLGFQIATGTRLIGTAGAPAFLNSWVSTGAGYEAASIRREGLTVTIGGTVQSGTAGLIFTLPVGFRPIATKQFPVVAAGGVMAIVQVLVGGNVQVLSPPASLSLDGINFTIGA